MAERPNRWKRQIAALALAIACVPTAATAARPRSPVRISGVLFDGLQKGLPEPDSAIRLVNYNRKRAAKIGGFILSDRFTPRRLKKSTNLEAAEMKFERSSASDRAGLLKRNRRSHSVRFPEGAKVPAGAEIWVAHQGKAFLESFGRKPAYELVDTLPDVPDLQGDKWLVLAAKRGTVALLDPTGNIVDFVPYDVEKAPTIAAKDLPRDAWKGEPLRLHGASANVGWVNRVLARDRDEKGRPLPDTDTAADWDGGFSRTALGKDPTHRIEYPGQSSFISRPFTARAKVLATSAPDNNYRAFIDALGSAKKSILVSVYQLTNPRIAEALIAAKKRGVVVKVWLEGSPVGGIPDKERHVADKLSKAGIPVHFLISSGKEKIRPRYRFDHSKYTIIDSKRVIIGTENYGRTGVPVHPSFGNRGWMIHIENKRLVRQLQAVWDHDYRPGEMRDVRSVDYKTDDGLGLPYKDPNFKLKDTITRGLYRDIKEPREVVGKMGLELVLSPDTSLNENSALIGLIHRAKKVLYIQQNSIRRKWGARSNSQAETPDLPYEAVIAAARRGVKTRVLLDGTWYNVQGDDDRDNDDVARQLNKIAREEGLDLEAKVINLETTALKKIHAKGIIVDDREVFVGSINWTENSFKGNREVGVIVTHPEVADYYGDLFRRDWAASRIYRVDAAKKLVVRATPSKKGKPLRRAKKGQTLEVVGEVGGTAKAPAYLEVRTGTDTTGYVRAKDVTEPVATPVEALHLIGRYATVEGRVLATRVSAKVVQLKFGDEERAPFLAVIFRSSEAKFRNAGVDPARAFQGRQVRVRGRVEVYRVPEIIVRGPKDIEILEVKGR